MRLRAATRSSPLARWQADHVVSLLHALDPRIEVELVPVDTTGDLDQATPLHELGGQGIFVKEVQAAVLGGRADLAVHSAKDLPSETTPGLVIAAVPERGDPRDALVGRGLDELAEGATVATGSVRRRVQLAAVRPDLVFVDLRGNIATRLAKIPDGGAIVMAVAALARLGVADRIAQAFEPDEMVPQVGQGALAVECRAGSRAAEVLAALDHAPSRACVDAERAFLAGLGGGCTLPVGAYARGAEAGEVALIALIAALDGTVVLRRSSSGPEPVALGRRVVEELLNAGGRSLLDR